MRAIRLLLATVVLSIACSAQTPTFVQGYNCPNTGSSVGGAGGIVANNPSYTCPFPNPTVSGNTVIMGGISDNGLGKTWTVTLVDASGATLNTLSSVISATTNNNNIQKVFCATGISANGVAIKLAFSGGTSGQPSNLGLVISEFYNVNCTASGTAVCHDAGGSNTTTVTTGNITVGTGNLLWMDGFPDDTSPSGDLTAGSGFSFAAIGNQDSDWIQYRLGTGSAINPTVTQATSHQTDACAAGFTATSSGAAPTNTPRNMGGANGARPASHANPFTMQVPIRGTGGVVVGSNGGTSISSITDSDSNTWTCTSFKINNLNGEGVCRAVFANTNKVLKLSINAASTTPDSAIWFYDTTGLDLTGFDTTVGTSGNQGSQPATFTTCTACVTPTTASGIIYFISNWDHCTALNFTSPSGTFFGASVYTGNNVDGPQPVDQNGGEGWLVYSSTSALTVTQTMSCQANINDWAAQFVGFKAATASSVRRGTLLGIGP